MSLVITGNPGVGKHSIAKRIEKDGKYEILDINAVVLDSGIFEKKDETIDVDINKLKKILKAKVKKKSLVVGHLAPYVLTKQQVNAVMVLRKNPYKLMPVYKKRKYSNQKTIENLGSEILGIIAFDCIKKFGNKTHQIDTTSQPTPKTVKKIFKILENKSKGDKVDWLSLISEKDDLKLFFPY